MCEASLILAGLGAKAGPGMIGAAGGTPFSPSEKGAVNDSWGESESKSTGREGGVAGGRVEVDLERPG